ncbi:hypothetical protein BDA99DRAFT_475296 [Phascolomyces articulosus]|uniref:Uncharacterized protein n=1 Tax=Phascolomyces articulosus TaxID=60185 RepID=A0AAD5PK79_9FUNG|nr:hypothetical protein BDA99DRAFT_475296 [Phascolomyces articulosus]
MRLYLAAVAFALVATSSTHAQTVNIPDNPYKTLEIKDAQNFCTFLPPADSTDRNIASTEYIAHAYCIGNTPQAMAAGQISDGFIQSAHYVATDDYVQVTGQIDPVKGNLNATDEGGQYDIVMPKGAVCQGWKHFVNLIEPAGRTYCLRCCHSKEHCNRGISEKGCAHIIPGDYSGPMDGSGEGIVAPAGSASSSSAAASATASGAASKSASASATSKSASASASSSSVPNGNEEVSAQSVDEKESSSVMTRPTVAIAGLVLSALVTLF